MAGYWLKLYTEVLNDPKSSKGYLMPIAEADKICLKKIVINKPAERV